MIEKPFSQASENNKAPILEQLQKVFADRRNVLEIGAGTGQHALYFAQHLTHLQWQPSDRVENLAGIRAWIDDSTLSNLHPPLELDVQSTIWPTHFDAVFSANTAHIMPCEVAHTMVEQVATRLPDSGKFVLYGPFKYKGKTTSPSNTDFDQWLQTRNPQQGLRELELLVQIGKDHNMNLIDDIAMPANNQLLVWQKKN